MDGAPVAKKRFCVRKRASQSVGQSLAKPPLAIKLTRTSRWLEAEQVGRRRQEVTMLKIARCKTMDENPYTSLKIPAHTRIMSTQKPF